MAKSTRICRVCGKEYEYCKTWMATSKFRYQDVACSPECGAIYFQMVEESRSPAPAEQPSKAEKKTTRRNNEKAPSKTKKDDFMVDTPRDHDDGIAAQ